MQQRSSRWRPWQAGWRPSRPPGARRARTSALSSTSRSRHAPPRRPPAWSFGSPTSTPSDAERKPPPITGALFELPEGTRIDGGAVPACEASDAEFRASGRGACPAGSRIGAGELTAITGFGAPLDPVNADVTVFNGGDELIELVSDKNSGATLGMDRLTIEGDALRAHPPATPGGPPEGRTAIRRIEFSIPARDRFLTSPADLPAGGRLDHPGHVRVR